MLIASFAGVALLLWSFGIYGVMATSCSWHLKEISTGWRSARPAARTSLSCRRPGMVAVIAGVTVGTAMLSPPRD
jgi:hypothetical protein